MNENSIPDGFRELDDYETFERGDICKCKVENKSWVTISNADFFNGLTFANAKVGWPNYEFATPLKIFSEPFDYLKILK